MAETNDQQPASNVQVSPEVLRKFADNLRTEAGLINDLDQAGGFDSAASALPGTDFGTAVGQATTLVDQALARIGSRFTTIADNMHNAAGAYELTEDDFAAKLRTIGLQAR